MNDLRHAIQSPHSLHIHQPAPRTYTFKRWSGDTETITAESVIFTNSGGLIFMEGDRLILAVNQTDWNNLKEVDKA
jgi:hypothetical protein